MHLSVAGLEEDLGLPVSLPLHPPSLSSVYVKAVDVVLFHCFPCVVVSSLKVHLSALWSCLFEHFSPHWFVAVLLSAATEMIIPNIPCSLNTRVFFSRYFLIMYYFFVFVFFAIVYKEWLIYNKCFADYLVEKKDDVRYITA